MFKQRFGLYKQLNPQELSPAQLSKLEYEIQHPASTLSDQYFDFLLWCQNLPSRQETFANFLTKKLSKHTGAKILEVGGGRTAILSRILSQNGFIMTCIDPKTDQNIVTGIEVIKDKFDYRKFDLSPYDYVVAQEPCDATEHVVRACVNQKKPFMMWLCGVPHKLISGQTPEDATSWYSYLKNIAPNEVKLLYVSLNPILRTPILKSNQF